MSGGVAILLALVGLLLIILGVRGTYADAAGVLLNPPPTTPAMGAQPGASLVTSFPTGSTGSNPTAAAAAKKAFGK